jgi:hypothetical protein
MKDHKIVVALMKSTLGANIEFSKSNRKGSKSLWVAKVTNGDGVADKLTALVESGEVEGWIRFSSRDGGTLGLQILVG